MANSNDIIRFSDALRPALALCLGALSLCACGDETTVMDTHFVVSDAQREVIEPGEECEFGGSRLLLSGDSGSDGELVVCNDESDSTADDESDSTADDQSDSTAGDETERISVETETEDPGDNCEAGGLALRIDGEVVDYLCNGVSADSAGSPELVEATALFSRSAIDAGLDSECPYGGVTLAWGTDAGDLNGELDADEIAGEQTLCEPTPPLCLADIVATTNEEVELLADCGAVFYGSLTLNGAAITNLAPLASLEVIHGTLRIGELGVSDLSSLGNLVEIRGALWLGYYEFNSDTLHEFGPSLSGLSALETILGTVYVYDSGTVTDFQGLPSITSLGGLDVGWESGVTTFKGLEALTSIRLANLPDSLTSYDGLDNVTRIEGQGLWLAAIDSAGTPPSLAALSKVTYISELTIASDVALSQADIGYLSQLREVGSLYIEEVRPSVLDLTGISGLTTVEDDVRLGADVPGLQDLLGQVTRVGGFLRMNSNISDASFLASLEEVGKGITVAGLSDFRTLSSLTSIGDRRVIDTAPTIFLPLGFTNCGLVNLSFVDGLVEYHDGSTWVETDAATYFGTLPGMACP